MDSGHTRFTRNLHRKREVWRGRITRCVKGGISVVAAGFLLCMFVSIAYADELMMKNGDRLQGTVVSMSLGKLVFKTSYAGDITIKMGRRGKTNDRSTPGGLSAGRRDPHRKN